MGGFVVDVAVLRRLRGCVPSLSPGLVEFGVGGAHEVLANVLDDLDEVDVLVLVDAVRQVIPDHVPDGLAQARPAAGIRRMVEDLIKDLADALLVAEVVLETVGDPNHVDE